MNSAAESLEGIELENEWKVQGKISRSEKATGGYFSVCYEVEKDGEVAFLKALDFVAFFKMGPQKNVVDIIQEMTETFQYERDILTLCRENPAHNIIRLLDSGEVKVSGHAIEQVPYLIFEMAECDVREKLNFSKELDNAWKLRSLHNIAKGLRQLHTMQVSHQDLKPSNVLIYDNSVSKIGDLGRSVSRTILSPHSELSFPGDFKYAPPEVLYGYHIENWSKRVYSIDLYLLGSLITFYFTGTTMTAMLSTNLDGNFKWDKWSESFEKVRPFLIEAFNKSLDSIKENIENDKLSEEVVKLVNQLCYPDPNFRGNPVDVNSSGKSYNLERFISRLDLLSKRVEYNLFR